MPGNYGRSSAAPVSADLGIQDALLRLALARAGSGLLGRAGLGQQPKVDPGPFPSNVALVELPICRYFVVGRAGIEPATLGLKVRPNKLRRSEIGRAHV